MNAASSTTIRCPKCSIALRISALCRKAQCAKCHAVLTVASTGAATHSSPPVSPPVSTDAASAGKRVTRTLATEPPVDQIGFCAYLRRHFAETHGLPVWGLCVGLLAVPAISLFKPVWGLLGLLAVTAALLVLTLAVGTVYAVQRMLVYFLCKRRTVGGDAQSWLASLTYSCLKCLILVVLITLVECFTPSYGLLATLVPQFRDEQARWASVLAARSEDGGTGVARVKAVEDPAALFHTAPETPVTETGAAGDEAPGDETRNEHGTPTSEPGIDKIVLPQDTPTGVRGNDGGAASTRNITRDMASRFDKGRKWAVIVGINSYRDQLIPPLEFCVADARLMEEALSQKCGYELERILRLTDDRTEDHLRPYKDNLATQISQWLERAEEGDTVLVFFSGHAFLDGQEQCYLAPQDCKKRNLVTSSVKADDVRKMLRDCKARQKLLILDCCHAGGLKDAETPGASGEELAAVFREASGLITLASCHKGESSREWKEKGQGLFTYFVVQGLQGAADDNRDSLVDSDELYTYTFDHVSRTAQKDLNALQRPVRSIPADALGVFALARVQPQNLTVCALFTVHQHDEQGPPLPGASVQLWYRSSEKDPSVKLGSATSDEHGNSEIPVTLTPAQQTAGEFRVSVRLATAQEWWSLRDFPKRRSWDLGLPLVEPPTPPPSTPASTQPANGSSQTSPKIPPAPAAITNSIAMKLVLIPAGEFMMGSSSRSFSSTDQQPRHLVRITRSFYLGAHEITVGQFRQFVRATGHRTDEEGTRTLSSRNWIIPGWEQTNNHPVAYISWNDAMAFCKWLSTKERRTYRLPTEAEWEYACRAGSEGEYRPGERSRGRYPSSVGQGKPNGWGLYDMYGNVREWCADWYDREYYKACFVASPSDDPAGPDDGGQRVYRGGCYQYSKDSAYRGQRRPSSGYDTSGFRVVCVARRWPPPIMSRQQDPDSEETPGSPNQYVRLEPPANTGGGNQANRPSEDSAAQTDATEAKAQSQTVQPQVSSDEVDIDLENDETPPYSVFPPKEPRAVDLSNINFASALDPRLFTVQAGKKVVVPELRTVLSERDNEVRRLVSKGVVPFKAAAEASKHILPDVAKYLVEKEGEDPATAVVAAVVFLTQYDGQEVAQRKSNSMIAAERAARSRAMTEAMPSQYLQNSINSFRNAFR